MITLRYHLKLLNYDYLLITGIVWVLGAFLTGSLITPLTRAI